ncbi:MAG TPA: hypothetical protein PK954_07965, partial [Anaerolineales bacterium]|nr:hypothetical protein [Anaerolineales bacterium]
AMLGTYAIEVIVDGEATRRTFEVEAYQKPEIAVQVDTDADLYIDGQKIRGTVDSRYFFDAPVAGANVAVRVFDVTSYCDWYGDCSDDQWYPHNRGLVSGVTDATGRFAFTLDATSSLVDPNFSNQTHTRLGIEATVTDDSGVPISAHRLVDLHQSSLELAWLEPMGVVRPGAVVNARARVTDLAGEAVDGQSAQLELRRWNERSFDYSEVIS